MFICRASELMFSDIHLSVFGGVWKAEELEQ